MMVKDSLRHIDVPLTPEEQVRQWFISVLSDQCGVPRSLMNSEVGFTLGRKKFRADILIWDRSAKPLAIVECKAPTVTLDEKVLDQAIRYNMVLMPRWIFLTNGNSTVVLRKDETGFTPCGNLPAYEEMTRLK